MIDIKFLRENPDIVKQNIKNKFQDSKLPLVDEVIALDEQARAAQKKKRMNYGQTEIKFQSRLARLWHRAKRRSRSNQKAGNRTGRTFSSSAGKRNRVTGKK